MSMGPLGPLSSVAGTPLSQRTTDVDKAKQDTNQQSRATDSASNAEKSSGIGSTDEEHGASDRDADGQKLWEDTVILEEQDEQEETPEAAAGKPSDPDGETGQVLDLEG